MDTCASFPVELRKAAIIAEENKFKLKKKKGNIILSPCLPALTHQIHCLGILISWREQQNKFCQKTRPHLKISDFSFPLLILHFQQ